MKILDRLPITAEPDLVAVPGGHLRVRRYQIVIGISVSPFGRWNPKMPVIPALVDTGLNHHFSIQLVHLSRWCGIHADSLEVLGQLQEGGRLATLRRAYLWVHRNVPGRLERRPVEPYPILVEGIAAYPDDRSGYPRLPLLGLRAIVKNRLKLVINGQRNHASLRSPLW